jgi:hypothetical protein
VVYVLLSGRPGPENLDLIHVQNRLTVVQNCEDRQINLCCHVHILLQVRIAAGHGSPLLLSYGDDKTKVVITCFPNAFFAVM